MQMIPKITCNSFVYNSSFIKKKKEVKVTKTNKKEVHMDREFQYL